MKKKKKPVARLVSDSRPTAANVDWPVFVPNDDGSTNIEIGKARLRYGTLVVEFKDSVVSVAVQNAIERGVLIGFGLIMLDPDVVNKMYQDVVAEEELDKQLRQEATAEAIIRAVATGSIIRDEESGLVSTVEDKTPKDIVSEHIESIIEEKSKTTKPSIDSELKVTSNEENN